MVCAYYGRTAFKVQSGDDVVAIDPFGKGSGLTPPRFEAHIVLLSDPAQKDFSITGNPIVFSTPGEYEARGISFVGIPTPEGTAFFIDWEGLRLLHLGMIEKKSSIEEALEHIETVDILMISTSGSPTEAQKIVASIDPRIIIPMQGSEAKKSALESFIKEIGEKPERLDKLAVKKKGLPAEGQRLVVLEAPGA